MRHFQRTLIGLACFALSACAATPNRDAPATPYAVGMTNLRLEDPDRLNWDETGPRPLNTLIWYPAPAWAEMNAFGVPEDRPLFIGGAVAFGVPAADDGPFPVVLLSHGTGGAAFQMMWLGRTLAEHGYIAIAVDHHGNTAAEDALDPRSFALWWERARDISAVLDQVLADPDWSDRIDRDDIAAAGFSIGGYTTAVLAGAITNRQQIINFCASDARDGTCDPQLEYPDAQADFAELLATTPSLRKRLEEESLDWSDDRISKFILIAPAPGMVLTAESLADIDAPGLVIGGGADDTAPIPTNAKRIADLWKGSELQVLEDATHYDFLAACTPAGLEAIPLCRKTSGQKGEIHRASSALVLEFLDRD